MKKLSYYVKYDDARLKRAISCMAKLETSEVSMAVLSFRNKLGYGDVKLTDAQETLKAILDPLIKLIPSDPYLTKMQGPRTLKQLLLATELPPKDVSFTYSIPRVEA